ncbi:MAG: hypothetical protein RIQ60_1521 [Pseudomonadota bacterium]|jgi:hypothetical protein
MSRSLMSRLLSLPVPTRRLVGLLSVCAAALVLPACAARLPLEATSAGAVQMRGQDRVEADAADESPVASAAPVDVMWANGRWRAQTLPGKKLTVYEPVQLEGRTCLHASSQASASMLRRKVDIAPADLGHLKFSWRVPALIEQADLTRREGEDSPVRVVLAFDGDHGELDLRTRAMFDLGEMLTGERPPYATLMYVWENRQPRESLILNPRTDRIRKIVVESGAANLGHWLSYERDVVADYQRAYGRLPGRLIGIAVMTDSDNTDSEAEAYYADLRLFGARGQAL